MLRRHAQRTTTLLAAAAYLLAIVASSISHVHLHGAAAEAPTDGCASSHVCVADHHDACQTHKGDCHQGSETSGPAHDPDNQSGSHGDDCNICRFLSRPLLQVRPFEMAETSQRAVPLVPPRAPRVQPVHAVVAHARAPPAAIAAL